MLQETCMSYTVYIHNYLLFAEKNQLALSNTLLEGLVTMSAFRGGHVREQSTFKKNSAAGFAIPFSSEFEIGTERAPEPDRHLPLPGDVLPVAAIDSWTRMAIIRPYSNNDREALTEAELQNIDEIVDRDLDPDQTASALVLWEDLRALSRKTKEFAEAVLRDIGEGTATSNLSAASATQRRAPRPSRESTTSNAHSEYYGSENIGGSRSSQRNIPRTMPSMINSRSTRGDTTITQMEANVAPQYYPYPMNGIVNSNDQAQQDSSSEKPQIVTLTIPRGDVCEIPFEQARTWKVRASSRF